MIATGAIDYSQLIQRGLGDLDVYDHRGHIGTVTGTTLTERIALRAAALSARGVRRGDRIVMVATNTETYLTTAVAVLSLGAIPCAVAPPPTPSREDSAGVRHLRAAIEVVDPQLVITGPREAAAATTSPALTYDELEDTRPSRWQPVPAAQPGDVHHIQLTSGSTSAPKAVVLSHRNVAHNINALSHSMQTTGGRMFSWLPMYHDMGFIQVLGALIHRSPIGLMTPLAFLRDPLSWLRHMSAHGSTVSAGPPFAYREAAKALRRLPAMPDLDLSSVRELFVGAEPIPYSVLREFADAFAPFGLPIDTLVPCYGMAESVLATTLATRHAPAGPGNFGRVRVLRTDPKDPALVSCGSPVDGVSIRIVDGGIQISGPSVMLGYLNRDGSLTRPADGWHQTGDLGFLRDGELFVVGRSKEMLIVRGRNYPPYDVEQAIATIPEVDSGNAVVFSAPDPKTGAEMVIVVVGTRRATDHAELRTAVATTIRESIGFSPDRVAVVARGRIPRTTSGKIQRIKVRELYLDGKL